MRRLGRVREEHIRAEWREWPPERAVAEHILPLPVAALFAPCVGPEAPDEQQLGEAVSVGQCGHKEDAERLLRGARQRLYRVVIDQRDSEHWLPRAGNEQIELKRAIRESVVEHCEQ